MRVKLEDVCERGTSNLKLSDVEGMSGDYPIYGASGYIGNVDFYHQELPYVAVVKDGAGIGRTTLHPARSSVIGTMQYLLPKDNVLPEYLFYVVSYMHLEKYFSGATIPHIYFKDYKNEEFNLDPLEKQAEIIKSLGNCERVIETRKQELQLLDELIKARFVEMFGDRYLNDRKWEKCKLGESMSFNNGKAHEQVVDENGEYILVTSRAIASEFSDVRRTNDLLFPLHKGDIVMVMSDVPNGRALAKCMLIDEDDKYTLNQRICSFDNYDYNPVFLCYLLNRHQYFLDFNDGNGQTNLRKNDILNCPLIIPPIELQEQFAAFVAQTNKSKVTPQKTTKNAKTH